MTTTVHSVASLVLMATCLPLFGSYPDERAAGMKLVHAGQSEAAEEYFLQLAESTQNPIQQSDALTIAALAMAKAGRPDEAMDLAAEIPESEMAQLCKILLLEESRQWQALVDSAAEVDSETWPEKLIFPALMARARGHSALGQYDQANDDLNLALESVVSTFCQAKVWHALAQNALAAHDDPELALAAYSELIGLRTSGGGMLQRGLQERALMLSKLGRYEEALADIADLEQNTNNDPHWICAALIAYGDVYRSMSEAAKAKSSYEQALAIPNAPATQIEIARKRLAESLED